MEFDFCANRHEAESLEGHYHLYYGDSIDWNGNGNGDGGTHCHVDGNSHHDVGQVTPPNRHFRYHS